MGEKLRMPYITDTILVNGTYIAERCFQPERRRTVRKIVRYDRRQHFATGKSIDIYI